MYFRPWASLEPGVEVIYLLPKLIWWGGGVILKSLILIPTVVCEYFSSITHVLSSPVHRWASNTDSCLTSKFNMKNKALTQIWNMSCSWVFFQTFSVCSVMLSLVKYCVRHKIYFPQSHLGAFWFVMCVCRVGGGEGQSLLTGDGIYPTLEVLIWTSSCDHCPPPAAARRIKRCYYKVGLWKIDVQDQLWRLGLC